MTWGRGGGAGERGVGGQPSADEGVAMTSSVWAALLTFVTAYVLLALGSVCHCLSPVSLSRFRFHFLFTLSVIGHYYPSPRWGEGAKGPPVVFRKSDDRVTSCFADFDQQNGFTGIAATGAVLKLRSVDLYEMT